MSKFHAGFMWFQVLHCPVHDFVAIESGWQVSLCILLLIICVAHIELIVYLGLKLSCLEGGFLSWFFRKVGGSVI